MADLNHRNLPKSPFSAVLVTEIRRSPYRGEAENGGVSGGRVAMPSGPSSEALIQAAMRACDFYGDDEAARDAMRQACADTPHELRADLVEHFALSYPKGDQP